MSIKSGLISPQKRNEEQKTLRRGDGQITCKSPTIDL
jgi:hypothetical protein